MTTAYIILPIAGAKFPSANSARPEVLASTASATSNAIVPETIHLLFDQTTDQHALWTFLLPGNYGSGGTLRFKWAAKVNSGNVAWKAAQYSVVDGTDNFGSAGAFDTVVTTGSLAIPGTVGMTTEYTLTLTGTNMAANREITILFGRDADADSAAGDSILRDLSLEYVVA